MKKKVKRAYIDVNVPRGWEPYLNEALELPEVQKALEIASRDSKPSSLGVWIIEQWLIDKTNFRFEHFNTYEDHVTIKDKKFPNCLFDIFPKPNGQLSCQNCDSIDCEHVQYVLTLPDVMNDLEKKGWKYREG